MDGELVKKRLAPATAKQKETLIEFMTSNPALVKGKFTGDFTCKTAETLWKTITTQLNSLEGGSVKTWTEWRRTWHDLKRNNIKKRAVINRSARGTGGGAPSKETWDDDQENISNLISSTIVFGDENVPVPNIQFNTQRVAVPDVEHGMEVAASPVRSGDNVDSEHNYHKLKPTTSKNRPFTKTARLKLSQHNANELLKLSKDGIKIKKTKVELLQIRNNIEKEKVDILKSILDKFCSIENMLKSQVSN